MNIESPWIKASIIPVTAVCLSTGLSLALYITTLAPSLTWAHHGADGGDLLTAALTNGVPHPSGYPLYLLLLQAWLRIGSLLQPSPAYLGNLFSAAAVAAAVGVTVVTAAHLLRAHPQRWLWAALGGCVLAVTPLFWSQALITEVYGLHALLVAGIGLMTFAWPDRRVALALLLALGATHHLTSILLWPAVAYAVWAATPQQTWAQRVRLLAAIFGSALLIGGIVYLRLLWANRGTGTPPPVNWGYIRDLQGLGWVVSGAPYRDYVFAVPLDKWIGRLAAMGHVLIEQFTVVGLLIALGGLAMWDHHQPRLRTLALLWCIPIAIYAVGYRTSDSYIYLIPVVWLLSLTFAQALASLTAWIGDYRPSLSRASQISMELITLTFIIGATIMRAPTLSLREDIEATDYLAQVTQQITPGSIIITNADAETFALWYAAWADDPTPEPALPDVVLLNSSLDQFGWYQDLMHDLYPTLPGIDRGVRGVIEANRAERPIYFTDEIANQGAAVVVDGPLFRLQTP